MQLQMLKIWMLLQILLARFLQHKVRQIVSLVTILQRVYRLRLVLCKDLKRAWLHFQKILYLKERQMPNLSRMVSWVQQITLILANSNRMCRYNFRVILMMPAKLLQLILDKILLHNKIVV